ncbi:hypothetical protein BT96DRAFT_1000756 [Gymnopus androsaceus JB14]|uniref:Uncharacterized protein n=1 Tax=Gymnopus androsaceus JB14 TaxID=1447944 RepID=A0A6A4H445_9AGAR|nr:hypothetical protein BT96DRAFT_1000756 [Gymnopus androsaceus JB14]
MGRHITDFSLRGFRGSQVILVLDATDTMLAAFLPTLSIALASRLALGHHSDIIRAVGCDNLVALLGSLRLLLLEFYLILNVAVGGTNGWFPDGQEDKPWIDASDTAMRDFTNAQSTWSATWPEDDYEWGMVVDYMKMWRHCDY